MLIYAGVKKTVSEPVDVATEESTKFRGKKETAHVMEHSMIVLKDMDSTSDATILINLLSKFGNARNNLIRWRNSRITQ